MAIHQDLAGLLKESVSEYLHVAHECLTHQKAEGGVYGFPAALLLFTILDTIGSFHRGDKSFSSSIDGKNRLIDGDGFKHYFILNTSYYSQTLTEAQIKKLYYYYRCLLSHNASLAPGRGLEVGSLGEPLFSIDPSGAILSIRLLPFYHQSVTAADQFLKHVGSILKTSAQATTINKKS